MIEPPTAAAPPASPIHIPLVDLGRAPPPALLDQVADRVQVILAESRRHYGLLTLRLGDAGVRRWLARNANPYRHEIAEVARRVGHPGAYLLNCSFEWSCTAGVGPGTGAGGMRMLRTLDWMIDGLGRTVVVVRRETDAGEIFDVTWPGLVGMLTAMAPGRFCAAINQPPLPRRTGSCWFDWAISRTGVWRRSEWMPTHLLRRVFETCRTYAEAKAVLTDTPVCVPVFFSLAGITPGEGCVIERREHAARVHEAPAAISNHWRAFEVFGHDRGTDSVGRLEQMARLLAADTDGLDWVTPPIRNWRTRLAVVADAAAARLIVQGFEAEGPVTRPFTLGEPPFADRPDTRSVPEPAA